MSFPVPAARDSCFPADREPPPNATVPKPVPNPILLTSGVLIGGIAAFLGIGGGVAIVPLLVLGFSLDQRVASGTSLGVIACVVGVGVAMGLIEGNQVNRPALLAFLCIAPTAMLAAHVVTPWIHRLPTVILRRAFAVILVLAAMRLHEVPPFVDVAGGGLVAYRDAGAFVVVLLAALGFLVGAVATLVGIGGGMLIIPALGLIFRDLSWLQCRATSLLIVLPTALVGFLRHWRQGTADMRFVRRLAPSVAAGSVVGSLAAHRADIELFQRAFGVLLLLVAIKLLTQRTER